MAIRPLTMKKMQFTKEFFAFQLTFAATLQQISGLPLPQVLMDFTVLYRRVVGLRDYDVNNTLWLRYLDGLRSAENGAEWTWQSHLYCRDKLGGSIFAKGEFGCFSFAVLNDKRIRLHFANNDPLEFSPLAEERSGIRRRELSSLIKHVQTSVEQPGVVVGQSWLYNLNAYRRIFPAAFIDGAQSAIPKFNSMTVWGQFMDRHGSIRSRACAGLLERLRKLKDLNYLPDCFAFLPLTVEAPIETFYAEYLP